LAKTGNDGSWPHQRIPRRMKSRARRPARLGPCACERDRLQSR
jgi:hypothetical protein